MVEKDVYFLHRIAVGPLLVNCYLFGCAATRKAIIIDPGDEADNIKALVKKSNAEVEAIVLTHGHYDHLGAVAALKQELACRVIIHEAESATLTDPQVNLSAYVEDEIVCLAADRLVKDGDRITVGKLDLVVLHTPGHSPGSICLHYDNILFGGDLLFLTSIGRCDLPGGSYQQLENSILTRIYTLPDDTLIYPGHGDKTTVGFEKQHNQFVRLVC